MMPSFHSLDCHFHMINSVLLLSMRKVTGVHGHPAQDTLGLNSLPRTSHGAPWALNLQENLLKQLILQREGDVIDPF